MPTKIEKDSVTGHMTTGHEWDGLKELNQPIPKWWLFLFWATVVWSAVYFVLYPSVPWVNGYFGGVLGWSQHGAVQVELAAVAQQRAAFMDKIRDLSFEDIRRDPQLMAAAQTAGRIAFADNCQACHGAGGGGNPGYPALAAGNWLWGGTLEEIQKSITYGVRSGHDDTRNSQMPRFGMDGILKPDEINAVADYVMTLYGKGESGKNVSVGQKIYADNCAVCHGDTGQGNRELGAPRLASRAHLNADDRAAVIAQISNPKMGVMPHWNTRLSPATIKALTLYVHSMGGGE